MPNLVAYFTQVTFQSIHISADTDLSSTGNLFHLSTVIAQKCFYLPTRSFKKNFVMSSSTTHKYTALVKLDHMALPLC